MRPMGIEQITAVDVKTTILTIVAVAAALVVILDLIIKARQVRKPSEEGRKSIDDKLENDNRRLNTLEMQMDKIEASQEMSLKVLYALLQHEVTGNHVTDMEQTLKDLSIYLINR